MTNNMHLLLNDALDIAERIADTQPVPVLIMEHAVGYGYAVGLRTDRTVRNAGKHVGTMSRYRNLRWDDCVKDNLEQEVRGNRCLCQ